MSFFRKGNKLIEVMGNRRTQLDLSDPNVRERLRRNPETRALVDEYRVEAGLQAAAPTKRKAGQEIRNTPMQSLITSPQLIPSYNIFCKRIKS